MAQIPITITINTPAGVTAADAVKFFTDHRGYQATIDGAPNPETRAQFAKRWLAELVKADIRAGREAEAKAAVSVPDNITVD